MVRGIRNNNPLNIRISPAGWKGKITPSRDLEFETFSSMILGIRAAMVNMRTHILQDSRRCITTTISREIARWAPASENNTGQYVRLVCDRAGISPDDTLDIQRKSMVCKLCQAMAWMETGVAIDLTEFESAYELI